MLLKFLLGAVGLSHIENVISQTVLSNEDMLGARVINSNETKHKLLPAVKSIKRSDDIRNFQEVVLEAQRYFSSDYCDLALIRPRLFLPVSKIIGGDNFYYGDLNAIYAVSMIFPNRKVEIHFIAPPISEYLFALIASGKIEDEEISRWCSKPRQWVGAVEKFSVKFPNHQFVVWALDGRKDILLTFLKKFLDVGGVSRSLLDMATQQHPEGSKIEKLIPPAWVEYQDASYEKDLASLRIFENVEVMM